MQKYMIMIKNDDISYQVAARIKKALDECFVYDNNQPSLVISVGGDGTMLESVHLYHQFDPIFIGIHTGTLGFFTDFLVEEVDELIELVKTNNYGVSQRHMLQVHVETNANALETFYALNEVRVDHGYRTQVFDVLIDGEKLERFRGNGVCVSTPSGSTAYNKALGGAVIYPELPLMQLTEVASINHNAYRCLGSSLIIGNEHSLSFENFDNCSISIGVDHYAYSFENVKTIRVNLSQNTVRFIQTKDLSFVSRLKKAFIQ